MGRIQDSLRKALKDKTFFLPDEFVGQRMDVAEHESGTEAGFADQFEKNTAVKVYAKLPGWFRVPTPLGNYNPDWAVLIEQDIGERLYFVVETKGSPFAGDLRGIENAKIECGKAHFNALQVGESLARYEVASSFDMLLAGLGEG